MCLPRCLCSLFLCQVSRYRRGPGPPPSPVSQQADKLEAGNIVKTYLDLDLGPSLQNTLATAGINKWNGTGVSCWLPIGIICMPRSLLAATPTPSVSPGKATKLKQCWNAFN